MLVERHLVTIAGQWGPRQVHYRRCGSGPAVLLLHQSPQSSAEYEQLMMQWAEGFTVIAPDHPGYGLSDPLEADPETELSLDDFATALAEFLDAVGISSAPVYGFHTGAGMAVALAASFPDYVSAVYANGYVVLEQSEQDYMLSRYLPAFEPTWDGSHLTWVWARNRDQLLFFPWFDRRLECRMSYTIPGPDVLQSWLLEFLRAGDYYRVAYRAAFRFDGGEPLKTLTVPAIITSTATDILREHLDRIENPAPGIEVRVGGSPEENLDEAHAYFFKHAGSAVPEAPATGAITGRAWNRMLGYEHGQLRVRCSLEGSGRPVLLMHDTGGSCETIADVFAGFIGKRPVVCFDLPGHGESHELAGHTMFLEASCAAILAVIDQLGFDSVDAWGEYAGGTVLLDFARRHPDRIAQLSCSGVQFFNVNEVEELAVRYAPVIGPSWHGGHLLEYWNIVRNQSLFWPWYRQEQGNIIEASPRLDADYLHTRVVALLQSAPAWSRICVELFYYPVDGALRDCADKLSLCAADWDPNLTHTIQAADVLEQECKPLPERREEWAEALIEFFTSNR